MRVITLIVVAFCFSACQKTKIEGSYSFVPTITIDSSSESF